jgi:beta-lactamase class A
MRRIARLALLMCLAPQPAAARVPQRGGDEHSAEGKRALLKEKLEAQIAREDIELNGVLGVALLDLASGDWVARNADEVFPTASSIKIAVLAELYRQEEQSAGGAAGKARLADLYTFDPRDLVPSSDIMAGLTPGVTKVTNRDLATFMVAVSDNSATNVLISRLGMANVNLMLDALGLKQTRLRRKMIDLAAAREGRENVSTPREMARLLEAIYRGRVFNKTLTEDFFRVLSTHKSSHIPMLLPEDVRVADKPGSLEAVRADCGIVFLKDRPFVISVMTTYDGDERAAEAAISRIALAAFRYFDLVGRASPYGRVISPR